MEPFTPLPAASSGRALGADLRVYNWSSFIGSSTIAGFQKRFSVSVAYETYLSNEELYARLKSGAAAYDIVVPSTYMVQILVKEGLLRPLDPKAIPNLKHICRGFLDLPMDPGSKYSVPYLWGTTGLGVNSGRVAGPGDDLGILFRREHKGRISMLDSMRYTLGIALKYLGISANTTCAEEVEEAKRILTEQRPLVKIYTNDSQADLLASGDVWISYGFNGDLSQAVRKNSRIRYCIPKQGSLLGMDSLCIPAGAQNPGLAHTLINYLLEPEVAAEITNELLYANPNQAATPYLLKHVAGDPSVYPPAGAIQRSEFLYDVGAATPLYERAWGEIKGHA